MRGTLCAAMLSVNMPRITPAYAGNTNIVKSILVNFWDHPRVCGEHPLHRLKGNVYKGSPPRMRGTLRIAIKENSKDRITPAYAGNTRNRARRNRDAEDHPRVCGEHVLAMTRPLWL